MTIAILDRESRAEQAEGRRWAICFAIVVALHALPAVVIAWWLGPVTSVAAPPPAAVMVDMEPLPAAPQTTPTEIPPGPQQTLAAAPPLEPQPDRFPDAPPARKPLVAVPPKAKPHRVQRRQVAQHQEAPPVERPPAAATTAPPAVSAPPSEAPAAPAQGASSAPPSNGAPTWQGLVLGRLEQFKRYPAMAQYRRQQGVANLRFTMDRDGKVLSARLEKTSGYDLLDQETLALIQRAQPLPRPPPDVPGDRLELVVPIEFFLHGRE